MWLLILTYRIGIAKIGINAGVYIFFLDYYSTSRVPFEIHFPTKYILYVQEVVILKKKYSNIFASEN